MNCDRSDSCFLYKTMPIFKLLIIKYIRINSVSRSVSVPDSWRPYLNKKSVPKPTLRPKLSSINDDIVSSRMGVLLYWTKIKI
jgi:hypothetical protein